MFNVSTSMHAVEGVSSSIGKDLFIMGNNRPASLSRDPSPTAMRPVSESETEAVLNNGRFKDEGCASPRSCRSLFLLEKALESCGQDFEFLVKTQNSTLFNPYHFVTECFPRRTKS